MSPIDRLKRARVRLAARTRVCLLCLVACCGAFGLTGASVASTASSVGACRAPGVWGNLAEVPGTRAMGAAEFELFLKNGSSRACELPGRPQLHLLGFHETLLPTRVTPRGRRSSGSVVIDPGWPASAAALLRVDIPDGHGDVERPGRPCEPLAVSVRLTIAASLSITVPVRPHTSVCGGGTIALSPLVPAPHIHPIGPVRA